jgi:hypothetical protein
VLRRHHDTAIGGVSSERGDGYWDRHEKGAWKSPVLPPGKYHLADCKHQLEGTPGRVLLHCDVLPWGVPTTCAKS